MIRRFLLALALLAVGFGQVAAHPLITPRAGVGGGGVPPSYEQIWADEFNGTALDCKNNGPLQWNRDSGAGTWSTGQYAQQWLQGGPGQMAEYFVDCQYAATVGGGYPSQGQISVGNGVLTITAEPTPASIAGSLPTDYQGFVGTGSIAGTDLTMTAVASGTPVALAKFGGTGVTAGTQIVGYGANASSSGCTTPCHYVVSPSQTVASTTLTGTGAWPYVSALISTRSSVYFKPPYCIWVRAQAAGGTGAWSTIWTQTRNQTIQAPTNGQVEFDIEEVTPTVAPNASATNYHWHADNSGGSYNNAGILRSLPSPPENGFADYVTCAPKKVGEKARFWINGVLLTSYTIPTSTVYESTYHFPIINTTPGNSAGFPGVGSGTHKLKVDFIRVFKPRGSTRGTSEASGADYVIATAGDGLGAERIYGPNPLTSGYSGGWTFDGSGPSLASATAGTAVDGLPVPAVIAGPASGGSFGLNGAQWNGNTTFGAAVNNQAYKFTLDFNYGTSNSIMGQLYTPGDGVFYRFTATGNNTVNVSQAGGGCTGTITTVASHRRFECTFTAGAAAAGFMNVRVSPNSDSGSQTVILYRASIKPTSAIFP